MVQICYTKFYKIRIIGNNLFTSRKQGMYKLCTSGINYLVVSVLCRKCSSVIKHDFYSFIKSAGIYLYTTYKKTHCNC